MSEYFVVYDVASGGDRWRGSGPPGAAALQTRDLLPGLAVLTVPQAAMAGADIDFAAIRQDAAARIDAAAEAQRRLYITPGAGQAMEYQEAVTQARAALVDPAGTYPMLEADVSAGTIDARTGEAVTTVAEAADLVLYMYGQWQAVGAAIREARLAAKVAIEAAGENLTAIVAAMAVTWPAP